MAPATPSAAAASLAALLQGPAAALGRGAPKIQPQARCVLWYDLCRQLKAHPAVAEAFLVAAQAAAQSVGTGATRHSSRASSGMLLLPSTPLEGYVVALLLGGAADLLALQLALRQTPAPRPACAAGAVAAAARPLLHLLTSTAISYAAQHRLGSEPAPVLPRGCHSCARLLSCSSRPPRCWPWRRSGPATCRRVYARVT